MMKVIPETKFDINVFITAYMLLLHNSLIDQLPNLKPKSAQILIVKVWLGALKHIQFMWIRNPN